MLTSPFFTKLFSLETMNAALWTRDVDLPLDQVVTGELAYLQGGPQPEQAGRVRVVALPGPQATLYGIARELSRYANWVAGSEEWILPETAARALLQYNRAALGVVTRPDLKLAMNGWRVGALLTLPLEMKLSAAGAVEQVVIDLARLRWLSEQLAAPEAVLVDEAVRPLGRPDPAAIAAAVKTRLTTAGYDPAAHAAELRAALLANPFAAVFDVVETLRQLRERDAGPPAPATPWRPSFALGLVDGIGPETARLLGWTASGNAILRAVWTALAGVDPASLPEADRARRTAALARAAGALGLVADGAGGFHAPTKRRPSVDPVEPPLTEDQRTVSGNEDPTGSGDRRFAGVHAMVHGRAVTAGKIDRYGSWMGPANGGEIDPVAFAESAGDAVLGAAPTQQQREALKVVLAIGPNEGKLDACRAADSAILSTGLQQWSAHTDTEMSVLLLRLQRRAPEHYDLLFGMYHLGVRRWKKDGTGPDDATGTSTDNPWDLPATDPAASVFGAGFPSRVRLTRVEKDRDPVPMKPEDPERIAFFGGKEVLDKDGKKVHEFSGAWTARVRMASLASIDYRIEQLRTGAFRFQRLADSFAPPAAGWPAPFRAPFPTLKELLSSEWSAAIMLDFHIQRPNDTWSPIRAALVRTLATNPSPYVGTGTTLDPAFLQQLHVNLLIERVAVTPKGGPRDTMASRNPLLLSVHDRGMSAKLGTFSWRAA